MKLEVPLCEEQRRTGRPVRAARVVVQNPAKREREQTGKSLLEALMEALDNLG